MKLLRRLFDSKKSVMFQIHLRNASCNDGLFARGSKARMTHHTIVAHPFQYILKVVYLLTKLVAISSSPQDSFSV